jgi:excisionase family DNA binding protein
MNRSTVLEAAIPIDREVAAAAEAQRASAVKLSIRFEQQRGQILDEKACAHAVELHTFAQHLRADIRAEAARGNAVKVLPVDAQLTKQEAANLLNVSGPHPVKLPGRCAQPYHKAGKHRRVPFADLIAFKAGYVRASPLAMEKLTRQGQVLPLGSQ